MVNGFTFFTAQPGFIPFPAATEVFTEQAEQYAEQFIPLASVQLDKFFDNLDGTVHFLLPTSICVDEQTQQIHQVATDSYSKHEYWLACQVVNGRYHMTLPLQQQYALSQPRFQPLASALQQRRARLLATGALHHPWAKPNEADHYQDDDRVELICNLAGHSFFGNWSSGSSLPIKECGCTIDEDGDEMPIELPLTEDGRPFVFIGRIAAYHYVHHTPDDICLVEADILLFFDPISQVALSTFEFS
ncbi:hypothetical protein [Shewanella sp.]|uniref:hypothetical protein n=1 Tax=Shewanella sp. TaxID=50422 RepID=UPI003A96BD73